MNRRIVLALAASALTAAYVVGCGAPGEADDLCQQSFALSVCPAGTTVKGIDVSTYQGTINWTTVKGTGQTFAIARVSDGTTVIDNQFVNNWNGIRSVGLVRGVYQFFRPGQDPVAQANLLISEVNNHGGIKDGDLPPVVDVEVTDSQSPATIQANLQTWLNHVQTAFGRKPIIYTAAFMSSNIGNGFSSYPLWVANYGVTCPTMPSNWTSWKMWQFTSTGGISGISSTNVDQDKWNGTLTTLQTYATWTKPDAGVADAGTKTDAGIKTDAGVTDAGTKTDAGSFDAGSVDNDAGSVDTDAGAATDDAGVISDTDAGQEFVDDAGVPDPGSQGAQMGDGIKLQVVPMCQ